MNSGLKKSSQKKSPELCIVAGPNGSGKTTITKVLLSHQWSSDSHYINPDTYANETYGDWNNPDYVLKAAIECTKQRYEYLEKKMNIVFETVLSSDEKVEYIHKAKSKGYFIRLFYVCTNSPEINAIRIMKRVMSGGHAVPLDKIYNRYYKSLFNLQKVIPEVDRCYLYDNSVENKTPELLFRTNLGKIEKIYSTNIPYWASNLLTSLREKYYKHTKLKI